jgi:hypothetical protein
MNLELDHLLGMLILPETPTTKATLINSKWSNAGLKGSSP